MMMLSCCPCPAKYSVRRKRRRPASTRTIGSICGSKSARRSNTARAISRSSADRAALTRLAPRHDAGNAAAGGNGEIPGCCRSTGVVPPFLPAAHLRHCGCLRPFGETQCSPASRSDHGSASDSTEASLLLFQDELIVHRLSLSVRGGRVARIALPVSECIAVQRVRHLSVDSDFTLQ